MTKCLAPDDIHARFQVCQAVGASFLLRLLLPLRNGRIYPRPLTDDDEIDNQIHLAGLGLSLVANLSVCNQVASLEEIGKACMVAFGTIKCGPSALICSYLQLEDQDLLKIPLDVETSMLVNCYDIITFVAPQNADVMESLLNACCFEVFALQLEMLYRRIQESAPGDNERLHYQAMCRCINMFVYHSEAKLVDMDILLPILSKLFALMSSRGDREQRRDEHLFYHFEALECLVNIVETHHESLGDDESEWIQNIKFGLESLLASKVPDAQRYKALGLALNVITSKGTSWLYSDAADIIFELLVQTLRVEIGVLILDVVAPHAVIEELHHVSIDGSKTPSAAGNISLETPLTDINVPKSADFINQIKDLHLVDLHPEAKLAGERALQNLPLCLILFEHLVEGLSSAVTDDAISMSGDMVQRVFDALTEIAELELQLIEQTVRQNGSKVETIKVLGIIWDTFCSFAAQNPHQFSERIIQVLPDVLKGDLPSVSYLQSLVPVLYGLVFSDRDDVDSIVKSLVQLDVFTALGQLLIHLTNKQSSSEIYDSSQGEKLKIIMLQELVLKLMRISLSNGTMSLGASQICEILPQPNDVDKLLSDVTHPGDDTHTLIDADMTATCIGLAARIHLISSKHEQILKCLLEKYIPRILETAILAEGASEDCPLYHEVFLSLKELCSKEPTTFGMLEIGSSKTPLHEVVFMIE